MKDHPIAIIGAGASGLFLAAILCELGLGPQCLIAEKTQKPAAKILISGGGRCNVTHSCFDPRALTTYYPRGQRELLGPFGRFQPKDTIAWFESKGVMLKTESDGRMFPVTDQSQTIADCLIQTSLKGGATLLQGCSVDSIIKEQHGYTLSTAQGPIKAQFVAICTGSHPSGQKMAQSLGHSCEPPVASLFSLHIEGFDLQDLAGVSLPQARVWTGQKRVQEGPLLITHWGFSGPCILKLSAWQAKELYEGNYQCALWVDWLPIIECERLIHELVAAKRTKKPIASFFETLIAKSLIKSLISKCDLDPSSSISHISDKDLRQLAQKLKAWPFQICGKSTHKQEFVTCGGVKLTEINFKTFESKLLPKLFFAGEVLNIDAVTGGFNFQSAWTGSWHIAQAIANYYSEGYNDPSD